MEAKQKKNLTYLFSLNAGVLPQLLSPLTDTGWSRRYRNTVNRWRDSQWCGGWRVWGEVSKYMVGVTHVSVYVCERDSCWHTQLVITAWHTYCALVIQTWIYELRVQSIHKHTHTQARLYIQHTSHLLYVFLALALTSKCGISVKINYLKKNFSHWEIPTTKSTGLEKPNSTRRKGREPHPSE